MPENKGKNKGFVILYAVIITTVVLVVGVSLMNIMTKQLVLSSISRNAKVSYYAALSGRACAEFWKGVQTANGNTKTYFGGYDENNSWQDPNQSSITCNGVPITLDHSVADKTTFNFDMAIDGQAVSADVTINALPECGPEKQLIITSEGYNDSYSNVTGGNPSPRLVRSLYGDKPAVCNL